MAKKWRSYPGVKERSLILIFHYEVSDLSFSYGSFYLLFLSRTPRTVVSQSIKYSVNFSNIMIKPTYYTGRPLPPLLEARLGIKGGALSERRELVSSCLHAVSPGLGPPTLRNPSPSTRGRSRRTGSRSPSRVSSCPESSRGVWRSWRRGPASPPLSLTWITRTSTWTRSSRPPSSPSRPSLQVSGSSRKARK